MKQKANDWLLNLYLLTSQYFLIFEKYEKSEQALLFMAEITGANKNAYFQLSQLMAKAGQYEKAYEYLRSAMKHDYVDVYQIRGTKYFRPMLKDKKRWQKEMGTYLTDFSKGIPK